MIKMSHKLTTVDGQWAQYFNPDFNKDFNALSAKITCHYKIKQSLQKHG
jgi:hypothetical protein